MIEEFDKFFIAAPGYQRVYDEMQAGESPEAWEAFRAETVATWFDIYEEGLRELGYNELGDFESYDIGTFTYSQDHSMYRDDAWWAEHRDNPRIVAVHGFSTTVTVPRDDKRLSAHRNSLTREFGESRKDYPYDKGHFIGHKLGGEIDNGVFAQRRDVNRGWGDNKGFYKMERFAQAHPGVFVFSRPIYGDGSYHPFYIEYGILRPDKTWWVEVFPNRYGYVPFQGFEGYPDWRKEQMLRQKAWWQAKVAAKARRESAEATNRG